ncbi:MAG: hypothetical protein HZB38_16905, partial [Planctomycetes bacterium]|nr:hypothetical protein [Planctomycetota bacterium]
RALGLWVLLCVPIVVGFAGCDEYRYEITMRRNADGSVVRELQYSVVDQSGGKPKATATPDHLIAMYGGESVEATVHKFSKSFRDLLPADVAMENSTNFGAVASSTSPLGTVFVYRERAPGPTQPWRMLAAFDRAVQTTISAWLAYAANTPELTAQPELLPALEALLRGPIHDDAMDFILIQWTEFQIEDRREPRGADSAGAGESELEGRTAIFLRERGYLDDSTLSIMGTQQLLLAAFEGLLRRIHVELGGDPSGPLAPSLARLLNSEEMSAAFDQGLCAIGLTPEQFSESMSAEAGLSPMADSVRMTVRWLDLPQPITTNGKWDDAAHELRWETTGSGGPALAEVLFATWALPDEAEQRRLFGQVVLGENLWRYNDWYRELPPDARVEWDAFVGGFSPSQNATARLEEFISRHEKQEAPGIGSSTLSTGAEIVREAISKLNSSK